MRAGEENARIPLGVLVEPSESVRPHALHGDLGELTRWLVSDFGFDEVEAYFLLTQAGRVRLGNMVDPKYTLGASMKKSYLA